MIRRTSQLSHRHWSLKEKAIKLRKHGLSYNEILQKVPVAKSTISLWCRYVKLAPAQIKKLESGRITKNALKGIIAIQNMFWRRRCESFLSGVNMLKSKSLANKNSRFIAGLMLYWGEGDKKLENGQVAVSNSDPHLIRLFYLFLTKVIDTPLEKISLRLLLYPDLIDSVQKNLWSRATKIHPDRFKKSTTIRGRHPTKRKSYGVCIIKVSSRQLKEKIVKWLDLSQRYFNSKYDTGID